MFFRFFPLLFWTTKCYIFELRSQNHSIKSTITIVIETSHHQRHTTVTKMNTPDEHKSTSAKVDNEVLNSNDAGKDKTTTMAQQKKDLENKDKKKKDQEEDPGRTEDGKVLDGTSTTAPNSIVCSFCSLPETATRNFDKLFCPCKSTRYCNTTCQRNHWLDHKKNCKHLIAERRRKKKLEKEQRDRDAN